MTGVPAELFSPAHTRTGRPSISTFRSSSTIDWLKRKFVTGRLIRPFSIRNVPSRVRPVCVRVLGLSDRIYQKRVIKTPYATDPIRSSRDASPPDMTKFDIGAFAGTLLLSAQKREYERFFTTPFSTHTSF